MTRICASVVLIVMVITLATGCMEGRTSPLKVRLDEPFWLKVEHRVQIALLELSFLRVLEDSRCPIDVVCVWEGNAQVELELKMRAAPPLQLKLNSSLEPTELHYEGYQIRYLDLEPRPCTRCRLNPKEFRLKLIVSRLAKP